MASLCDMRGWRYYDLRGCVESVYVRLHAILILGGRSSTMVGEGVVPGQEPSHRVKRHSFDKRLMA